MDSSIGAPSSATMEWSPSSRTASTRIELCLRFMSFSIALFLEEASICPLHNGTMDSQTGTYNLKRLDSLFPAPSPRLSTAETLQRPSRLWYIGIPAFPTRKGHPIWKKPASSHSTRSPYPLLKSRPKNNAGCSCLD